MKSWALMCTGQSKLLKQVMGVQQCQQILFLVNLPKQHLIMQTMAKKMLHNMSPMPLFISTAAMESLISRYFPRCLLERDGTLDQNSTRAFAHSHCKKAYFAMLI